MVNYKCVTRPRLWHSQRGPRKIWGCPTAMSGLLGPARVGRSRHQVAAPRASGDGHRPVSRLVAGGGGGGSALAVGLGHCSGAGVAHPLVQLVGAAWRVLGRVRGAGPGTPGSMKCHCFTPCPNIFHRKIWGPVLLSGVWSVCLGISWLLGGLDGCLRQLRGCWSLARCAPRAPLVDKQDTCTGRWWFKLHRASPAGQVERRWRAPLCTPEERPTGRRGVTGALGSRFQPLPLPQYRKLKN